MSNAFKEYFYDENENEDMRLFKKYEADNSVIEKYQNILPSNLLDIWVNHGWSSYSNGMIQLVNPDKYKGIMLDWIKNTELMSENGLFVIAITAFGELIVLDNSSGAIISIDTYYSSINYNSIKLKSKCGQEEVNSNFKNFIILFENETHDIENNEGDFLFDDAFIKLGPLQQGEIYGFEQILPLGGDLKLENLIIVSDLAHLSMLMNFSKPKVLTYN